MVLTKRVGSNVDPHRSSDLHPSSQTFHLHKGDFGEKGIDDRPSFSYSPGCPPTSASFLLRTRGPPDPLPMPRPFGINLTLHVLFD